MAYGGVEWGLKRLMLGMLSKPGLPNTQLKASQHTRTITGVGLGGPKARYLRKHYKEVKLKKVFWSELKAMADRLNLSIPELIQLLYNHYTTCSQAQHPP